MTDETEELKIRLLGYRDSGRQEGTKYIYVKLPTGETVLITDAAEIYENIDGKPLSMNQLHLDRETREIQFLSYIPVRRKK